MNTLLVAGETAAEERAVTIPLKDCSAILAGDTVVIAYSLGVFTRSHARG